MAKVRNEKTPLQSLRIKHLTDASKELGTARQKEAFVLRADDPNFPPNRQGRSYNLETMATKARLEREKARRDLYAACAACILRDRCKLVGNLDRWERSHPYAKNPKSGLSFQEDRTHMLSRINKDPDAACDPHAITPLPEKQLELPLSQPSTPNQEVKTSRKSAGHYGYELEN